MTINTACALIAELLDCGFRDADEVLRLVNIHGEDVVEASKGFSEDCGVSQNFGTIIEGVKSVVFWAIRAELEDEGFDEDELDQYDEWLTELTIDDNYVAWGCVAYYGDCPEEVGNIFAEIMYDGLTKEHKAEFAKAFKEAINCRPQQ